MTICHFNNMLSQCISLTIIRKKNRIFALEIIWNANAVRGWILITSIWYLPKLENELEKRGTTRMSKSLIFSTMNL